MKRVLLKERLENFLAVDCELDNDEIGLYVASADVSASCAFKIKGCLQFVEAVNTANASLELS